MIPFSFLEDYTGPLALFPLPSVVFFPHNFLPLHVFEPRYRKMVRDVLEKDPLIGIVLLKPGWEKNYYGNPPIYDIACLGQIMRVETFSDGRFNILLYGLSRVNMMEIKQEYPYRTAKVRLLRENPLSPRKESHLRREIWNTLSQILEPPPWGFSVMSAPHLDVGFLTDMIAYAFPFALNIKQELLESVDIETRVGKLLQALEGNEGKGKRVRIRELPFLYELARN